MATLQIKIDESGSQQLSINMVGQQMNLQKK